jgi:hypothetical protein
LIQWRDRQMPVGDFVPRRSQSPCPPFPHP